MNVLVQRKYKITKTLGQGKFGVVHQGQNVKTNEYVAIKHSYNEIAGINIIKNEASILNYLYRNGCRQVPFVYLYGVFLNKPTLVMSYYDCSLEDYCKVRETPKDASIAELYVRWFKVMLNVLEEIHSHFIIHRDIKPQNFMIKDGDLFLIDFGLATTYTDSSGNHISQKLGKTDIIGTPKYISMNVENGIEPARRDDVISACYIFLYMHFGELPWNQDKCPRYLLVEENDSGIKNWRTFLKSWDYLESTVKEMGEPFYSFIRRAYLKEFKDAPVYTGGT